MSGVALTADLSTMLSSAKPDVVIQATCSKVEQATDEIKTAVQGGANVISIAEEMAYPSYEAPGPSEEIRKLAMENKVTVVGTGINPGFVLDLLVISLTGVCYNVESISAKRVNDLSPYGPSVLQTQGVGITPEAFSIGMWPP